MSEVWTDEQIYQYAMDHAKARSQAHWDRWMTDPTSANMWTTYNTILNPNWVDPWFEHELYGNTNIAPSGNTEGFKETQNMYMIYCYLKNKGWGKYALTALLASNRVESHVSGGVWQSGMHPYGTIVGYDSTYITGMANYTNWHSYNSVCTWTAETTDERTGVDYQLPADPGSWNAVKKYYIKTDTDSFGHTYPLIPLRFDTNSVNPQAYFRDSNVGYGLVQWTPFGVLISHAGLTVPYYGNRHWQINLTLQLMVLEFERKCAMEASPNDQWAGDGHPYYGEWQDASAASGFFTYQGNSIYYGSPMTWDAWCNDAFVQWAYDKCDELGITDPEARDWAARQTGMSIFGRAYLHNRYVDHSFQSSTLWIKHAIEYWDAHGGGDIRDVPRPRDLPESELDQYHTSQGDFIAMISNPIRRRRNRKNVTIFV